MEKEKGFFGFIIDAQKDTALSDEFKKTKSLGDLIGFFQARPRYEVDENECDKIWQAREALCDGTTPEEVWDIICGGRGY